MSQQAVPLLHSLNKSYRMEGVPESGTVEERAKGYKSSIYRSIQTGKDNTRIF